MYSTADSTRADDLRQHELISNKGRAKVFLYIADNAPVAAEDLLEQLGLSLLALGKHLGSLGHNGLIEKSAKSTRGDVFRLSKSGRELIKVISKPSGTADRSAGRR